MSLVGSTREDAKQMPRAHTIETRSAARHTGVLGDLEERRNFIGERIGIRNNGNVTSLRQTNCGR